MPSHPCPRCGQPTEGSYSEGGLLWAICGDCMRREQEALRMEPPARSCAYCDNPACAFRARADEWLCRECWEDWLYCERRGKEPAEP